MMAQRELFQAIHNSTLDKMISHLVSMMAQRELFQAIHNCFQVRN